MKKKKLEVKLAKTKQKLAITRSQLDEMLTIMEANGMPKSGTKSVVGEKPKPAVKAVKPQTAAKTTATTTRTPAKSKTAS